MCGLSGKGSEEEAGEAGKSKDKDKIKARVDKQASHPHQSCLLQSL